MSTNRNNEEVPLGLLLIIIAVGGFLGFVIIGSLGYL